MKNNQDKNFIKRAFDRGRYALKRFFRPIKGLFVREKTVEGGEDIESPSRLLRQAFFRKKTAVLALIFLIALFAFVFIAPAFISLDINYTDPLQQNAPPSYSLRKIPKKLKNIDYIDGFSNFTVGVSTDGKLFVWGNDKDKLSGVNLQAPQSMQGKKVAFAAAGKDHIAVVTKEGEMICWGDKSCGQYGFEPVLNALPMPEFFKDRINPQTVRSLACGYQTTALVTAEGKAYLWGNQNAVKNLGDFADIVGVQEIVFTNSVAVALLGNGKIYDGKEGIFTSAISNRRGEVYDLQGYLVDKRVDKITANGKCIAMLLQGGEVLISGAFENGEEQIPTLQEGEFFLDIDGGTRHFIGVTNYGNAYAWGHNGYKQCSLKNKGKVSKVFAGSLQSYALNEEGKCVESAGLKGYIMGTDGRGRDLFSRLVHGGKMTLTIGSVAVVISSIIAVIIGCLSGYFGGVVDTLLMRVTEIFSSIPFLPFAMLLSQIIKNYNIGETARIFIIMLILGALSWTGLARMIRGQVLSEREKEFVLAAKAMGVKESKIAFRHILPNILSVVLVSMTLDFAGCLLTESALSYLGFGVQQPRPTWGNMLTGSNNSIVIQKYWWQWVFPALFLSLAVVCINILGDALRDALDPKNTQR